MSSQMSMKKTLRIKRVPRSSAEDMESFNLPNTDQANFSVSDMDKAESYPNGKDAGGLRPESFNAFDAIGLEQHAIELHPWALNAVCRNIKTGKSHAEMVESLDAKAASPREVVASVTRRTVDLQPNFSKTPVDPTPTESCVNETADASYHRVGANERRLIELQDGQMRLYGITYSRMVPAATSTVAQKMKNIFVSKKKVSDDMIEEIQVNSTCEVYYPLHRLVGIKYADIDGDELTLHFTQWPRDRDPGTGGPINRVSKRHFSLFMPTLARSWSKTSMASSSIVARGQHSGSFVSMRVGRSEGRGLSYTGQNSDSGRSRSMESKLSNRTNGAVQILQDQNSCDDNLKGKGTRKSKRKSSRHKYSINNAPRRPKLPSMVKKNEAGQSIESPPLAEERILPNLKKPDSHYGNPRSKLGPPAAIGSSLSSESSSQNKSNGPVTEVSKPVTMLQKFSDFVKSNRPLAKPKVSHEGSNNSSFEAMQHHVFNGRSSKRLNGSSNDSYLQALRKMPDFQITKAGRATSFIDDDPALASVISAASLHNKAKGPLMYNDNGQVIKPKIEAMTIRFDSEDECTDFLQAVIREVHNFGLIFEKYSRWLAYAARKLQKEKEKSLSSLSPEAEEYLDRRGEWLSQQFSIEVFLRKTVDLFTLSRGANCMRVWKARCRLARHLESQGMKDEANFWYEMSRFVESKSNPKKRSLPRNLIGSNNLHFPDQPVRQRLAGCVLDDALKEKVSLRLAKALKSRSNQVYFDALVSFFSVYGRGIAKDHPEQTAIMYRDSANEDYVEVARRLYAEYVRLPADYIPLFVNMPLSPLQEIREGLFRKVATSALLRSEDISQVLRQN